MRRTHLLSAVALASLIGTPASVDAQLADHTYTADDIQNGSRIYTADCALCHGVNGDGVDAVNLRTGQFRRVSSDDDIRAIVASGVGTRMPAYDLSETDMNGVIAFIRAGFDPEGVAVRVGDAEAGAELFTGDGNCWRCHRVMGEGPHRGPDLSNIGAIRTPSQIQRKLLDPTAGLRAINRPVRIVTASGEEILGRRLNEDTYSVQLMTRQGQLRSIVKSEIVDFEVSTTATMRPTSLSPDQVADVVGYLLSLRGHK